MPFSGRKAAIASVLLIVGSACSACSSFGSNDDGSQAQQPSGSGNGNGDAGDGGGDVTGEPAADSFLFVDTTPRTWLMVGEATTIPVTIKRGKNFTDAVTVTVTGLRDGITVKPLTITQDSGELEVTVPSNATHGALEFIASGAGRDASGTMPVHSYVRGLPGSIDTSFGDVGVARVADVDGNLVDFQVGADDTIVGAVSCNATTQACISRLLADGKVDTTFQQEPLDATYGAASGRLAIQPDGKVVIPLAKAAVARLTTAGALDTSFGNSGQAGFTTFAQTGSALAANEVLALTDGTTLVEYTLKAGSFYVARLDATGGIAKTTPFTFGVVEDRSFLTGMLLQPDGKLVIAGQWEVTSSPTPANHRALRIDGQTLDHDTTFGTTSGYWAFDATSTAAQTGIVALPTGTTLIPMRVGNTGCIVAVRKDGESLDLTFGLAGRLTVSGVDPTPAWIAGFALQPDGKIVVARTGSANNGNKTLLRYNADGKFDTSFGNLGRAVADNPSVVRLQSDGRILVGKGSAGLNITRYWN